MLSLMFMLQTLCITSVVTIECCAKALVCCRCHAGLGCYATSSCFMLQTSCRSGYDAVDLVHVVHIMQDWLFC